MPCPALAASGPPCCFLCLVPVRMEDTSPYEVRPHRSLVSWNEVTPPALVTHPLPPSLRLSPTVESTTALLAHSGSTGWSSQKVASAREANVGASISVFPAGHHCDCQQSSPPAVQIHHIDRSGIASCQFASNWHTLRDQNQVVWHQ